MPDPVLSQSIAALWHDFLRYRKTGITFSPDDIRLFLNTLGVLERHAFDMEQQLRPAGLRGLINEVENEAAAFSDLAGRTANTMAMLEGMAEGKVVMLRMPDGRCPAEVELDQAISFLKASHGGETESGDVA